MDLELRLKVSLAIELLIEYKEPLTYDKIMNLFMKNGISNKLGKEIYLFLPTIFCKKMLPKMKFPKTYYEEYESGERVRKEYYENDMYNIMKIQADNHFDNGIDSNNIIKIAGLSSEFNVINDLLLKGNKLEDIKLKEIVILR